MTRNVLLVVPTGISNQYVVQENDDYLLIDTGLRYNYTNLVNFLSRQRISAKKLKMVVITHADGDHYGCLNLLVNHSSVKLTPAASAIEAEAIGKGISSRPLRSKGLQKIVLGMLSPLFTCKPVRIERILIPGETLPFLGGLLVLDTKGHTPGHISLWSETEKTLFSGDSINIRDGVPSPSRGVNTWDEDLARKSFEMQMDLHPDHIYGGHGVWNRE
jgi:glyoxylase-like metal-dependent hydrolase (beta-lactamase superfamily II)